MDKFAQKRTPVARIREKINMPGAYLEGFFKPELDRIMTELKSKDDQVRAILTGQKIGTAEAPKDGKAAKAILKAARTNFNRREYMTGIIELGLFHKKMLEVAKLLNSFSVDVNKIHHKFLFEGVKEENLKGLREHMQALPAIRKAEAYDNSFIKTAGIIDDIYNIWSKRGRSLMAWEKKYPKETKDLRDGAFHLLDESQKLLDNTISYLKEMGTARAIRRPDDYLEASQKIISDFNKFDVGDKGFRSFYNGPVKKWLDIKDEIDAKQQAAGKTSTEGLTGLPEEKKIELGAQPTPRPAVPPPATVTVPGTPSTTIAPTAPAGQWMTVQVPGATSPAKPTVPFVGSPPFSPPAQPGTSTPAPETATEFEGPPTERKPTTFTHKKFYESLVSMGGEDPYIVSSFISKYAKSIQGNDPETAIKLFSIVKRLKG